MREDLVGRDNFLGLLAFPLCLCMHLIFFFRGEGVDAGETLVDDWGATMTKVQEDEGPLA